MKFANREDETHVLVGTAKDVTLSPRTCSGGAIHTYLLTEEGKKLEFLHKVRLSNMHKDFTSGW